MSLVCLYLTIYDAAPLTDVRLLMGHVPGAVYSTKDAREPILGPKLLLCSFLAVRCNGEFDVFPSMSDST